MENLKKVDHAALKINQVTIIVLNILAFVLDAPWLAAVVALAMLTGTLLGLPGFVFVYQIARNAGRVQPHILDDHPEPHRFAQAFGGVVMFIGALALFTGIPGLGWFLVWFVAALAALNAFGGFCVGCFVYYWLSRFNLPGFRQSPPPGTFPGMRPKRGVYES